MHFSLKTLVMMICFTLSGCAIVDRQWVRSPHHEVFYSDRQLSPSRYTIYVHGEPHEGHHQAFQRLKYKAAFLSQQRGARYYTIHHFRQHPSYRLRPVYSAQVMLYPSQSRDAFRTNRILREYRYRGYGL